VEYSDYVLIALIACFAAFVQANVGFGYALLFAPVAAFFIEPVHAISTSIVSGTLVAFYLYADHRPRASFRSVAPMVIPAALATPIGLWLLATSSDTLLRLLLGAGVLISAAVNLRHPTSFGAARVDRLPLQIGAGMLSGVMRGAVSMSGPPIILYQHWVGGGAEAIRTKMFAFFAWTGLPAIMVAASAGIFTREVWLYSAAACIAIPVGAVAGRIVRPRMGELVFTRLSMGLLGGTAAIATLGAALAFIE